MVTQRLPAGLVAWHGALAPNARMQEAIEAAGFTDDALQAIMLAWASLDGHEVEVDYPALVAAVYDPDDGLPSDEWRDFGAELGEGHPQTLVILAMASCWRTTGKRLCDLYPDSDRDRESERLHRRPRRNRPGPRINRFAVRE